MLHCARGHEIMQVGMDSQSCPDVEFVHCLQEQPTLLSRLDRFAGSIN